MILAATQQYMAERMRSTIRCHRFDHTPEFATGT
jgi:hypothetical protein